MLDCCETDGEAGWKSARRGAVTISQNAGRQAPCGNLLGPALAASGGSGFGPDPFLERRANPVSPAG